MKRKKDTNKPKYPIFRDMILYLKDPKDYQKILDLLYTFSKDTKINIKETSSFSIQQTLKEKSAKQSHP